MKQFGMFFHILIFISSASLAREYIYPVAYAKRDSSLYVYLIHQISLHHLEFLEWNKETKVITKALTSSLTPSGIKILPDASGYSFIDQGQIYIKLFSKRSARKIDLHTPLYDIEVLEWIDSQRCLFSAKYHEQVSVYQLFRSGDLQCIMSSEYADCLYPQKVDTTLFYIERSFNKKNYAIKEVSYPDLNEPGEYSATATFTKTILEFDDQPIAFLHMLSKTQGYYIAYPGVIDRESSYVLLSCHTLICDSVSGRWTQEKVFDFSIPLDLVLPRAKDRLYESLLPLLPRYTLSGIYYCDCYPDLSSRKAEYRNHGGRWYEAQPLNIYYYSLVDKTKTLKTPACEFSCDTLAPLIIENDILYGSSISGSSKHKPLLSGMWRNEYGQVCYELPQFNIKG